MSPPPTSIDGTDITGATIDGQEVQEITVDGETVFTATERPVAYSNLVAWWPFDSSFYGGSNTDDVTAILGGSGDDTAYDLTINGTPSYLSSGGVTDINKGGNSGAFDFSGNSNNVLTNNTLQLDDTDDFTVTGWHQKVTGVTNEFAGMVGQRDSQADNDWAIFLTGKNEKVFVGIGEGDALTLEYLPNWDGTYSFAAFSKSGNDYKMYGGGGSTPVDSGTFTGGWSTSESIHVGVLQPGFPLDGAVDDVRIYNTPLSGSEINQIYLNTEP